MSSQCLAAWQSWHRLAGLGVAAEVRRGWPRHGWARCVTARQSCQGTARPVPGVSSVRARFGTAVGARSGSSVHGNAWQVSVWLGSRGSARCGTAGHGVARPVRAGEAVTARPVKSGFGAARPGKSRQSWQGAARQRAATHGLVCHGPFGLGSHGNACFVVVGSGVSRCGSSGRSWSGWLRRGPARQGAAWHGSCGQAKFGMAGQGLAGRVTAKTRPGTFHTHHNSIREN